MNREVLLNVLPAYKNKSVLIRAKQDVDDIMDEVCEAHYFFSDDYNSLADFFYTGNVYSTCANLFSFCKDNIRYKVETVGGQTTKSPSAILTHGYGDCKHYAGFIGGVLDAINRIYDANIKWQYRFASYDLFNGLPQHVFVVVKDKGEEIWIDPVLRTFNERLEPVSIVNKKISGMSLNRISGTNNTLYDIKYQGNTIGWTIDTSYGYTTSGPAIVPKIGDDFYGDDYLGLSRYGNPTNTNIAALTQQLQAIINESSYDRYTLDQGLVDKIIRENVENWNFFFAKGTSPKARPWATRLRDFIMLTVTPDGRLTFDRDAEPPHDSPLIHYLVDQMNYLVQAYSDEPYIVTMEHAKRLGKGWKTPQQGSAWHVIHTGDVNFTKITDFIKKIPGLSELAATVGLNLDSMINMASKFLTGNRGTGSGSGPLPPVVNAGGNNFIPWALIAAGGFMLTRPGKSKVLPLILLGSGGYLLYRAQPQNLLPVNNTGTSTATPGIKGTPDYLFDNSPDGVYREPETTVPLQYLEKGNAADVNNVDEFMNEYKNFKQ